MQHGMVQKLICRVGDLPNHTQLGGSHGLQIFQLFQQCLIFGGKIKKHRNIRQVIPNLGHGFLYSVDSFDLFCHYFRWKLRVKHCVQLIRIRCFLPQVVHYELCTAGAKRLFHISIGHFGIFALQCIAPFLTFTLCSLAAEESNYLCVILFDALFFFRCIS